jgi:hypothetical protein
MTVHVRTRQRKRAATDTKPARMTIQSRFMFDGEPFSIVVDVKPHPKLEDHARAALDAVETVTKSIGSHDGGRILVGGYAFPIIINK